MDEVPKDTQYDVTDEHRLLVIVPLFAFFSLGMLFLYQKYKNYREFRDIDSRIKKLKVQEYDINGMLLVHADETKFIQKIFRKRRILQVFR